MRASEVSLGGFMENQHVEGKIGFFADNSALPDKRRELLRRGVVLAWNRFVRISSQLKTRIVICANPTPWLFADVIRLQRVGVYTPELPRSTRALITVPTLSCRCNETY